MLVSLKDTEDGYNTRLRSGFPFEICGGGN